MASYSDVGSTLGNIELVLESEYIAKTKFYDACASIQHDNTVYIHTKHERVWVIPQALPKTYTCTCRCANIHTNKLCMAVQHTCEANPV